MNFSKALQDEVDYLLDLAADTAEDEGEAFVVTDATVYRALRDIEDRCDAFARRHAAEMRRWQIARGVYSAMSPCEVANTTVTRGTVWEFKLDGTPYAFRRHIE